MARQPSGDYLANLLAQANRQFTGQLEQQFRTEGISVEQWRVLEVLAHGGGYAMSELAQTVSMNLPTLTKTIDRMVSNALVYRTTDQDDRRKVLVHASDRGLALADRLTSKARAHQTEVLKNYGKGKAADLKRLLEGLIEQTRAS